MSQKRSSPKSKSQSGKNASKIPNLKPAFTLTPEQQYKVEEQRKLSKIKNNLYDNIDKFSDRDRIEMIASIVGSLNDELDRVQRKIQTQATPEEKKKKYRHLFDENGIGMIEKIYNNFLYLGGESSWTEEVHIDDVDWKNVSGTINHYEYGKIPVVFIRTSITGFLDQPTWQRKKELKEFINESLKKVETDLKKGLPKEKIFGKDNKEEYHRVLSDIERNIRDYKQIGYADEISEEEQRIIDLRKKYNIWTY